LWFGILSTGIGLAALVWPFVLSVLIGNVVATLWIYGVAIVLDIVLLVVWALLAIRYSRAAGRGELFDVPWVARVTGTSVRK
jgi:hypothetical protein